MRKLVNILLCVILLSSCKYQDSMIDKSVVNNFDVDKYLGKWYEIARFDHSFEKGMQAVTATYSYRDDGMIKVVNSGYKGSLDGEFSEAIGKAKIPNINEPSKLKVSFFWIFYGDYFVLDIDKDYKWALVGSRSDKYLWILSRSPHIDDSLYSLLLDKLTKRGYDVKKLIKVKQRKVN